MLFGPFHVTIFILKFILVSGGSQWRFFLASVNAPIPWASLLRHSKLMQGHLCTLDKQKRSCHNWLYIYLFIHAITFIPIYIFIFMVSFSVTYFCTHLAVIILQMENHVYSLGQMVSKNDRNHVIQYKCSFSVWLVRSHSNHVTSSKWVDNHMPHHNA